MRAMPLRLLPFLALLLLSALLLAAGAAHGTPTVAGLEPLALEEPVEAEAGEEGGEEVETECDTAYEEADEGVLSEEEAGQICEVEAEEEESAAKPSRDKGEHKAQPRHRAHKHKKACHKKAAGKRHCSHRPRHR
jgi:hypothetical protein